MTDELTYVTRQFRIAGKVGEIQGFKGGHINQSYKVRVVNLDDATRDYFLQKINHRVFRDVHGLMRNIQLVSAHLQKANARSLTPDLIITRCGSSFLEHEGNYWRMYEFMHGYEAHDKPDDPEIVFRGAGAFAELVAMLGDADTNAFATTIPRFHDMRFRMNNFKHALQKADNGALKEAKTQIDFVRKHADYFVRLFDRITDPAVPLRITHNDTKLNNVIFNDQLDTIVVDLDTIMPGQIHFDFGDGVRTSANTADEDEADLALVDFDMNLFRAFNAGYKDGLHGIIQPRETALLTESIAYMTFMMGLRFLTDHLEGDVYYHTRHSGHNLQRSRCQLHFCQCIFDREKDIRREVMKH